MKKSFGLEFKLVNDIRMRLPPKLVGSKRWVHLATVKRGLKEYMAFLDEIKQQVYIEEVDPTHPGLLREIEDDNEFNELYLFLLERGCLMRVSIGDEMKIDTNSFK